MERYVVAAGLKPGKAAEAERQLAGGPPFDPASAGLSAHEAYVTHDAVFLVFEGASPRSVALHLAREHLVEVSRWQEMVTGLPSRVESVPPGARCAYRWSARPDEA